MDISYYHYLFAYGLLPFKCIYFELFFCISCAQFSSVLVYFVVILIAWAFRNTVFNIESLQAETCSVSKTLTLSQATLSHIASCIEVQRADDQIASLLSDLDTAPHWQTWFFSNSYIVTLPFVSLKSFIAEEPGELSLTPPIVQSPKGVFYMNLDNWGNFYFMIDFYSQDVYESKSSECHSGIFEHFCGGRQINITITKKEKLSKLNFSSLFFN